MAILFLNHDVEILFHPDGTTPPQVIGLDLLPEARATDAVRHMSAYVGRNSLPKYLRGAATLLSAHHQLRAINMHSPDMWEETALAATMWEDVLKGLDLEPKWSSKEGCFHIKVADEDFDRTNVALCGAMTLYDSALDRHLYAGERNPLTSTLKINRPGRRAARSLFRIKRDRPKKLRTQLPAIVERIRRAGQSATRRWPPSVTMLIDLMIEGLARLSEQIALTLLDWWEAGEFGERINTPNKGDEYARTKVQVFSLAYAARLRRYVDVDRVDRLELEGGERRTLEDFRKLAMAGDFETLRAEALFTNAKGGFFSQSGIGDYYLRPAMQEAGLDGVTSHAIRHAGVCAFFAWLAEQDLPAAERAELKLFFGRHMGWKWPEAMLDHYSEPERRKQATEVAINFLQARRQQLEALEEAGLAPANDDEEQVAAHNDDDLDRLAELEAA